jgi:HEAT repeat protein
MQGGILKEAVRALSNQQSEETKKLFNYILATSKNLSLYPAEHSTCKDSINQLHAKIEAYIRKNGDITIKIERDRVICQGVEVKTGLFEEGTLPHTLFRDGIGWLQFTEGIEQEEIRKVFSIIHRYSVLMAEPQGDIVTDFWESRFEHVQYKADDFFSEKAPDQSDSFSKSENTSFASEAEIAAEQKDKPYLSGGPDIDPAAFDLTPREEVELQEMVHREETASAIEHLNMLMDMLLQYEEEKDFNNVLEVLAEEYKGSYGRHDFESALIILDETRKVLDSGRLGEPWAVELLMSFYDEISSDADSLKPLEAIWSALDEQQVETLRNIFQHLQPPVVNVLANLLTLQQPQQREQIVSDTIFPLVCKDMDWLESLINNSDERIVAKLIPILSRLEKSASVKYLMKLTGHSSSSVRRTALKAILDTGSNQISAIFEFIDDKDASIRRIILTQMGKSKSEIAENFLLQYLQNKKFRDAQSEHIVECFKALGKCGSSKSVPFLSKTLMSMSGSKTSLYREGAALALAALQIPEARQVMEKAGRSLRPGLRRIAREAEKGLFHKKKGG